MASQEREYEKQGMRKQHRLIKQEGILSVFTRGKHLRNIDVQQLKTATARDMKSTDGRFYFTPGFSKPDGGDVPRP